MPFMRLFQITIDIFGNSPKTLLKGFEILISEAVSSTTTNQKNESNNI